MSIPYACYPEINMTAYLMCRAEQIHRLLMRREAIQLRWHNGHLLTYRYPVQRGYGTRGELIAVYTRDAPLDWIKDDLRLFLECLGGSKYAP